MSVGVKSAYMLLLTLLIWIFTSCSSDSTDSIGIDSNRRSELIVENEVFRVSYNEVFEQPNWLEYVVKDRPKNVDRAGMDFYKESGIHTSDDRDYYNNVWDKGHMAPAATFSDTYDNLYTTFSFLNCALQYDDLNRVEWAQLESKEREWAKRLGNLKVRIEVLFDEQHEILPTGAHIPTAFTKRIEFPGDSIVCFYFVNDEPKLKWEESMVDCD